MQIYNQTNFFKHTFCEFQEVDKFKFPENTNYKSKSESTYFYTDEGKAYYEVIKDLKTKHIFCNATWMEFFESFTGIDDTANYIFSTSKHYENVYDFVNLLQISPNQNCYFSWDVKDIINVSQSKSYYNVFSKKKRSLQIDTLGEHQFEDENAIKWIIEYGVSQVKSMINCGIHRHEKFMQRFVETWTLNPASFYSKGIIVEYELKPTVELSESKTIHLGYLYNEFFNICPQYRYQILEGMCLMLCKYGLEFGKLNSIPGTIFDVQYDFLLK